MCRDERNKMGEKALRGNLNDISGIREAETAEGAGDEG